MADPLLGKNRKLRQAISKAYDMGPVIELFYNGRAIPAMGPIPPGLAGYDPNFANPYRKYDLAEAKRLLKEAGYPDGKGLPVLDYSFPSSTTSRQFAEYFKKSMEALGIQVKLNGYTWPEFLENTKKKKGQIWGMAWGADYPDAENFLQLFYSKNASPGPNDSNYSNPEFDKLYEQSLKAQDTNEKTAIYKKMVAIVTEDCPWVFGAHRLSFNLRQPWLKNAKFHEFVEAKAKYLRVDLDTKAKYVKK
jgi:ABC-type transport system substrate-binding protein